MRLTHAKGPQWLPYTFENPYIYLFNSLLLIKGQAPYHIDHPGTTTQVFGAVLLRMSSLKSNDELISSAIRDPETYIWFLHSALLASTALVLWMAPWLTAIALRRYVVGLLIQAPALFYACVLFYGVMFGSDLMLVPFSVAAVCCCALLVIPSVFRERYEIVWGIGDKAADSSSSAFLRLPFLATLSGLVCAFGIATKLTFFPLILISAVCCRNKKNLAVFTVTFLAGLALALLPIYSQLPRLATWVFNLGIHSGRYNTGTIGLPQTGVYLSTLSNFVNQERMLIVIPCVTFILITLFYLSKGEKSANPIPWRIALYLLAIQVMSFLVDAKEFESHYLIPLCLTTGLSLVFLLYTFENEGQRAINRIAGWVALIGLLGFGLKGAIDWLPEKSQALRKETADQLRLYRHAREVVQNDVRVDYFFSDSPEYPVCYGNDWAGGAFSPLLANIYPKILFFDVSNSKFQTYTGFIEPQVIRQKYDHLYFLGYRKLFPKIDGFEPEMFETIDHAGEYYLQKWTRR
jgi:hypothetical protein